MTTRKVRKSYERVREQIGGWGPSVTDQAAAQETDINRIVARFKRTRTGLEPDPNAQYGDVSALNEDLTVLHAQLDNLKARAAAIQEQQSAMDKAGTASEQAGTTESAPTGAEEGTAGGEPDPGPA